MSSLATWGEADGIAKLVGKVLDNPRRGASSHKGDDIEEEDKRVNTNQVVPSQSRGRTLHGGCEGVGLLWGGPI